MPTGIIAQLSAKISLLAHVGQALHPGDVLVGGALFVAPVRRDAEIRSLILNYAWEQTDFSTPEVVEETVEC